MTAVKNFVAKVVAWVKAHPSASVFIAGAVAGVIVRSII